VKKESLISSGNESLRSLDGLPRLVGRSRVGRQMRVLKFVAAAQIREGPETLAELSPHRAWSRSISAGAGFGMPCSPSPLV
jgi:hypothetical protein